MSKGFFTIAQNNSEVDYIRLAYALALSLKVSQKEISNLTIAITPGTIVPEKYSWAFDNIVEIIWGDSSSTVEWKLNNEWKSIYMSPYDETIKLDCDMLFFKDISNWWELLSINEFQLCNNVINYKQELIDNDYYRKTFTINKLPDIYTAFMYFKKTDYTFEIFKLVEFLYKNWEVMSTELLEYKYRPELPNTDIVFALALKLLDLDGIHYTKNIIPIFTHMKTKLQNWTEDNYNENWQLYINTFFNKHLECKIGNHLQLFPLHYHRKDFITDEIITYYEQQVRNK
jgi:hypothetical protein